MSDTELDSPDSTPPLTPTNLHQNTIDPDASWLVQKFGGTSVGKFAAEIADTILPTYLDQHKVAIVCSARSGSSKALGTTNLLLKAASQALKRNTPSATPGNMTPSSYPWNRSHPHSTSPPQSPDPRSQSASTASLPIAGFTPISSVPSLSAQSPFSATVDLIKSEHVQAARSLIKDTLLLQELELEIEHDCEALRSFLFAAQILNEISPRSKDSIVGVGERLSCKLVAAVLRDRGIDSEFVSLENIVPFGDDLDSSVDHEGQLEQDFWDRLAFIVGERIRQCAPRVPVVTGFFGPLPGSLLRQVGRGYTDLLSALLAVGLEASELQIWKEVDGIFTADPRKVPTARLIPIISPEEAAELTYYGSEVVHPFTMEQVIRRNIPIRIKNVQNPRGGGTVIHPNKPEADSKPPTPPEPSGPNDTPPHLSRFGPGRASSLSSIDLNGIQTPFEQIESARRRKCPTAVTIKERILVLNINSNKKSVSHGFLARIFSTLDEFGVVVDMITTSEVHVSMAIEYQEDAASGKRGLDKLVRELEKSGTVSIYRDMAILSLVGKSMHRLVGMAGRMFATLADGNVNIEMISQGASEINISCVIEGKDATKALNLVHQNCLQVAADGTKGRVGPWLF